MCLLFCELERACPPELVRRSGYGLVAEHVLAKDETAVRFRLPAHFDSLQLGLG